MLPSILGCLILELETGQPLYSHFFDPELKKNPSVIPQKIRSGQLKLVHDLGQHAAYSALVSHETHEVREYLRVFRQRVEKAYPDGFKRGSGNFADYVVLENIVTESFGQAKE